MSYENAPATRMLATHCAVCGNPLVDSESIETGMGPICRKRHGYGRAQDEPNFQMAYLEFASICLEESGTTAVASVARELAQACTASAPDARGIANKAVRWIAAQPEGKFAQKFVAAIALLGYQKLARTIARRRLGAIEVVPDGLVLIVKAPYNERFIEMVNRIPGQHWDGATKTRRVPVGRRKELWQAMRASYAPGTVVAGTHVTKI